MQLHLALHTTARMCTQIRAMLLTNHQWSRVLATCNWRVLLPALTPVYFILMQVPTEKKRGDENLVT